MDISKIEKLLRQCDFNDLLKIEKVLMELIGKVKASEANNDEEAGRRMRCEKRFQANLLGTLTRVTDVKPGERKEYSVTIVDISRSGMCLHVDNNFISSRIVEVTFAGPGGKIKQCFLEIVRIRKMNNQDGNWLELGCRSVNNEEVRRLRLQEEQTTKTRSKLHSRRGMLVMLVGRDKDTKLIEKKLASRVQTRQYNIRCVDSVHLAMKSAEKTSAQLAIFCHGSQLSKDPQLLEALELKPPDLATLAIIEREEDRVFLLQAGIDECLAERNYDNFLFSAIERAMVGHAGRSNKAARQLSGQALIVSIDNTRVNLVSYQLEEHGYSFRVATDLQEAKQFTSDMFDLVLADFDAEDYEEFKSVRQLFGNLSVIALCEDVAHGQHAIVNGASNYLCMPPREEDIQMVLDLAKANLQLSSLT